MATSRNIKELESVGERFGLTEEQWEDLYFRLRYFTYGYYTNVAGKDPILEDLIHESVVAALLGKRVRPESVSLFVFICGIIRSKTSHHFDSEERKLRLNGLVRIATAIPWKDFREQQDLKIDLASVIRKLEAEIKDDEELTLIHRSLTDDPDTKPSEIAKKANLPISKVNNAKKRYNRLFKKIYYALKRLSK